MADKNTKTPSKINLPFPKRWLYYIAMKIIVLAVLIYVALAWKGLI